MKSLTEIRTEAIFKGACAGSLYPFKYLNEPLSPEKELLAWQVILGNIEWLRIKVILFAEDVPEIEKKANYIAVQYDFSGKTIEYGFKDGKKEGLYIEFYRDESISILRTYRKGIIHGIEKDYHWSSSFNIEPIKYSIWYYWEGNLVTKTQYYFNELENYIAKNCRLLLKAFKGIF
jgi:hypothetical protein